MSGHAINEAWLSFLKHLPNVQTWQR